MEPLVKNKEKLKSNAMKDRRERCELLAMPEGESNKNEVCRSVLPVLGVVLPNSRASSIDHIAPSTHSVTHPPATPLSHGDESMTVLLSAFYAKLIIVLGVALPVTSTIQDELYSNILTDIFSMYLYIVSMVFLAYTFYHLRLARRNKDETIKRTRYGSFYLHMGVAGFSVGSVIYSCLQLGGYFDLSGDCQLIIVALKPALRILFMAVQTVFIFSYSDILDPMRGVVVDRFGLMHLIATNVCEWLNVVIQETRDDIISVAYGRPALPRYANITGPSRVLVTDLVSNVTFVQNTGDFVNFSDPYSNITLLLRNVSWTCNVSDMITPLIRAVNPYLRPCGVEYSLLCSIIIAVIWNDICTVPGSKSTLSPVMSSQSFTQDNSHGLIARRMKSSNHFSVDCGGTHKGLFMGVGVLAGTIVSLMLFNGLFQNANGTHRELALLQINIWETILFILMTVGSAACIQRMRRLTTRRPVASMPMEHWLLLVTQCGVYLYYLFQIIGTGFVLRRFPEGRRATRIISPLCAVVQSSCQTLLVLDVWSRRSSSNGSRPGRQLVTFLLVGNFALWLLNRVKNARAEFHPLQMEFYGVWAWTLITHVSCPLLVCYRFQATVCFYEIWKNSYKSRREMNDLDLDFNEPKTYNYC